MEFGHGLVSANWTSGYLALIAGYGSMGLFDMYLRKRQLVPDWVARYKFGLAFVVVSSLVSAIVKGLYLERYAEYYIGIDMQFA